MNNDFTFKPYEKVLVRDSKKSVWIATLYSNYVKRNKMFKHKCVDGYVHLYCIPFKNNEHLLGTTKDFFMPKKGDVVYCIHVGDIYKYPRVFHHYDYDTRFYVTEEYSSINNQEITYSMHSVCEPYTMKD